MVARDRKPLAQRVEADETYVGGLRPGKPGRGAAGKALVVGAVETGRGKAKGRRLGRLRLAGCPMPVLRASKASSPPTSPSPLPWRPTAGAAISACPTPATATSRWITPAPPGATPPSAARHPPGVQPRQALAHGHPPRCRQREASASLSRRVRLPLQPPHRQAHQPRLRPPDRAGGADRAQHLRPSSRRQPDGRREAVSRNSMHKSARSWHAATAKLRSFPGPPTVMRSIGPRSRWSRTSPARGTTS